MNNFGRKKSFFSVENMAKAIIIFVVLLIVLTFVVYGIVGYFVVTSPEVIGGWFGDLLGSFISNTNGGGE